MPIIIFGIKDGNNIESSKFSGHMYTYLPTSLNIRLPFIFQIPFDLVDNRSCLRATIILGINFYWSLFGIVKSQLLKNGMNLLKEQISGLYI